MYSLDSWHYIPTEYRSPPNPLLELSAPYNRGLLWKTPRTVEDGLGVPLDTASLSEAPPVIWILAVFFQITLPHCAPLM